MASEKSKNDITIEQLNVACSHFFELKELDMTTNIAIRQIVKMVDIYSKMRVIGKCSVDRADEFSHWSIEAIKLWIEAKTKNPKAKYGSFLRVEHGTPRTQFTEIVLSKYKEKKLLTIETMEKLIREKWEVAVITREEDKRLSVNGGRTNKEFKTPFKRWEDAGIKFPTGSKPDEVTFPDKRRNLNQTKKLNSRRLLPDIIGISDVTGRDNQIIIEALSIAIPIMLKNTLDASNVFDMMRIVEARGGELTLKNMSSNLGKFIFDIIEDLKNGKTYSSKKKSAYIDKEIKKYLSSHMNEERPL